MQKTPEINTKVHHCHPLRAVQCRENWVPRSGEANPVGCFKKKKKNRSFQFLLFFMSVEFKKKYPEFPQRLTAVQTERKVSIYRKVLCVRSFFDDRKPTVGSPVNGKRKEKMKSKQLSLWQCNKNAVWDKNLKAQHLIYLLTFKLSIISVYCKPYCMSCMNVMHRSPSYIISKTLELKRESECDPL